jgi:YYY domain-containing protein
VAADLAVVAVTAFGVFRVLQPYAFGGLVSLDGRWLDAMDELSRIESGGEVPPNVQWAARVPVLEPLGWLVRFGFGLPATVLAIVGVVAGLRRWRDWREQPALALLAGWVVLCGAVVLPRFSPFMRYLLPAYPALAVLAGCGAAALLTHPRLRAARVGGVVLLTAAGLWALAFVDGVQRAEHPRLAASQWLVDHAPDGATISAQEWDDGLPVASPAADAKGFRIETLRPFATATPDDVRALVASLDRVDYVVDSSERVSGSVGRVPARYGPVLRYEHGLDDGSLAFELVAEFSNRPSLLGWSVDDTASDEAFRVYDHPTVRIWRKTAAFSVERAFTVLQPDRAGAALPVPLADATANGLQLRGDGPAAGPTFDQAFPGGPPAPWLWWFAWWELTALAALGWVARLFRSLPDRGLGIAKVVGPLAVVVPLWAAVAWGLVDFSRTTAWAATALALALGLGLPGPRRELAAVWREHRRAVLAVEALTVAVFGAVLLLRAANPDLWFHPTGGEKPFDTAFFTAVARSSTLPPGDPWFSGGAMNYYYAGWFALSVPTRALGLRPELALNLAVATTAALIAAVSWSIGAALTRRVGGGLLATGAVLVAGNLDSARQQVVRASEALSGSPAQPFDWWATSRLNAGTTDINEFPAWSVLFGDPHPHLLALPALLTTIAVLCAYVATRRDGARARAAALAGVAGVGLAWTRIGHTWDLPALALLAVTAVAVGSALDRAADDGDGDGRHGRWRTGARHLAAMGAVAVLLPQPYTRATQVFDRGFTGATIRTPLSSLLLQVGLPLGLGGAFLAARAVRAARRGALPDVLRQPAGLVGAAVAGVGAVLVVVDLWGWSVLLGLVVAVAALVSATVDLRAGDVGRGLATGLLGAGAALLVVPDVVTVINDIGRQNTVFKFGFTAWALLALGAAALATEVLRRASAWPARIRHAVPVGLGVAALATLVFWPSAAPRRLDARFHQEALTLNGRAWLADRPLLVATSDMPELDVTADEELIAWLRAHGRSGETIVEAVGPSYSWVSRASVATGLPTVLGWKFHEEQQRRGYNAAVQARAEAVGDLYTAVDDETALRVLATYRPDYVVVGTVEHALGSPAGLATLADLPGLERVFHAGDSAIYRVDHRRIDRVLARLDAERLRSAPAQA